MPIAHDKLQAILEAAFPDGTVKLDDTRGDGDHYSAYIESGQFAGKTRIQQHRMVYEALKGTEAEDLHALAIQTSLPEGA